MDERVCNLISWSMDGWMNKKMIFELGCRIDGQKSGWMNGVMDRRVNGKVPGLMTCLLEGWLD